MRNIFSSLCIKSRVKILNSSAKYSFGGAKYSMAPQPNYWRGHGPPGPLYRAPHASEGKSPWANQISSTYLNWRLRYNYFRFWKNKRPPYWKSIFGFDFGHLPEICTLFCIRLPNFVQIEAPTAEIWRHIHFSKWRPRRLNITSGFVSVDVTAFRRSKSISKPDLSRYLKWRLIYFYGNPKWLGKGSIFFKLKNVSISWDALLHFMNTIPAVGVWRLKNHLRREKTSPQRLILYDNFIIISSTHRFVSSHFCLKIPNAVCGVQS